MLSRPSRASLDGFEPLENRPAEPTSRAADRVISAIFAAAVLAIGIFALNPFPVGVLHDDAVYVILAKSLATGQGFRYLNLPGEPLATHFPPGYPLFLAALWRVMPDFPGNVVLFKAANAVFLALGFVALRALLRRGIGMGRWSSAVVAFVGVASVPMLFVSTLVLSETLFFALAAACILLAERVVDDEVRWARLVGLGLLCAIASLVRTPGVALIGGVVVCLALRRRWRDAVIVGGASALALVPWMVWAGRHGRSVPDVLLGAYGSYTSWFGDALKERGAGFAMDVLGLNIRQGIDVVAATVGVFGSWRLNLLALVCLAPLVAVGVWIGWRRARVLTAFVAIYTALILIWPSHPARYIWGVWPFLVIFPALATQTLVISHGIDVRWRAVRVALLVVAIVPAIGYARYNLAGYQRRTWLAIPRQGAGMLRPLVNGIRERVEPGAVVAAAAEAAVYLYTDRQTVPVYTFTADGLFQPPDSATRANALASILRTYPVDVVVGSTPEQQLAIQQVGTAFGGSIAPVASFPGGVIYRCKGCGTPGTDHAR